MGATVEAPANINSLRVLLVEDNDGDARLVEQSIADASTGSVLRPFIELDRVVSLSHARNALSHAKYDVVLLDLGLPDSHGLETLTTLRVFTEAAIVVLTGLADEEFAVRALHEGAQDYLFKGDVAPALAVRALRYACERRNTEALIFKTRWLAGIGDTVLAVLHEINNPLTTLVLNAELLASGDKDPALPGAILESAKRIADVTHRLAMQRDPKSVELIKGLKMLDLNVA